MRGHGEYVSKGGFSNYWTLRKLLYQMQLPASNMLASNQH